MTNVDVYHFSDLRLQFNSPANDAIARIHNTYDFRINNDMPMLLSFAYNIIESCIMTPTLDAFSEITTE